MGYERYLPPHLDRKDLAAAIGLVSDTHMPLRRRALPPNLGEILGGVDLLLHAGDVGELWVLDQLSAIAPVMAVHGNDDTDDAQRELPFQQLIAVAGMRILLWHSHYPDWREEMESRRGDELIPKLQRTVDQAKSAGAKLAIFGHWHIPFVYNAESVTLVNPGALAAGNEFTRQLRNTVALLLIEHSGEFHIIHIDISAPDTPYDPQIDWNGGFIAAAAGYSKSILAPDLADGVQYMRAHLTRDEILAIRPLIAAKAMPIWEREGGELTFADVEDALVHDKTLSRDLHSRVLEVMHAWQNDKSTA